MNYIFLGNCYIYFLDKPYQEINFKSHLHRLLFVNKENNYCYICTYPVWFYFTLFVCAHFCNEIEKWQLQNSLKYFSILRRMKNNVKFEYAP